MVPVHTMPLTAAILRAILALHALKTFAIRESLLVEHVRRALPEGEGPEAPASWHDRVRAYFYALPDVVELPRNEYTFEAVLRTVVPDAAMRTDSAALPARFTFAVYVHGGVIEPVATAVPAPSGGDPNDENEPVCRRCGHDHGRPFTLCESCGRDSARSPGETDEQLDAHERASLPDA